MALRLSEGLGLSGERTRARMISRKDAMKDLPARGGFATGVGVVLPPPRTKLIEAQALPMAAGSTN